MIFDFPNIHFSDEEWKCIIINVLKGWTEIPLNSIDGYDVETVKFYDAFLGTLIKQTEKYNLEYPEILDKEFVDSWKYQGKLYRVLHKCPKSAKSRKYRLPKVKYDGMIAHWTTDYTFQGLLHKLSDNEKYIILEADTGDHFAFDVNRFRRLNGVKEGFTKGENEIIFQMYKENIKEHRMTIREFVKKKQDENL